MPDPVASELSETPLPRIPRVSAGPRRSAILCCVDGESGIACEMYEDEFSIAQAASSIHLKRQVQVQVGVLSCRRVACKVYRRFLAELLVGREPSFFPPLPR
ncbi:hypothetical protein Pla52o_17790 [Novipirellula galeiformis]|uniref:Uncharacterized protein n=1 Tax=Novipirellula galeiformis TaxID=2528004 RepID=A0A5C6CL44_9BACT|nr:hypothetical protein Pla52o_17790 [Novipirellula galeiformis]